MEASYSGGSDFWQVDIETNPHSCFSYCHDRVPNQSHQGKAHGSKGYSSSWKGGMEQGLEVAVYSVLRESKRWLSIHFLLLFNLGPCTME